MLNTDSWPTFLGFFCSWMLSPSIDTVIFTFFFFTAFARNSYCKQGSIVVQSCMSVDLPFSIICFGIQWPRWRHSKCDLIYVNLYNLYLLIHLWYVLYSASIRHAGISAIGKQFYYYYSTICYDNIICFLDLGQSWWRTWPLYMGWPGAMSVPLLCWCCLPELQECLRINKVQS